MDRNKTGASKLEVVLWIQPFIVVKIWILSFNPSVWLNMDTLSQLEFIEVISYIILIICTQSYYLKCCVYVDIMSLNKMTIHDQKRCHFVAKFWSIFKIQRMQMIQTSSCILSWWFFYGTKQKIVVKIWIKYFILSLWQFMDMFSGGSLILTTSDT